MAWIELHQAVRDHRKIVMLGDALDMPEPHVVGHLAYLWLWAVDNAPDGVLPDSNRVIARAAHWIGDPDQFVGALLKCGLLDNNSVDREIHDWDEYAGKLIERRKANALRMKKERATNVQRTSREPFKDVQSYSTVPNPTEQNTTKGSKDTSAPTGAERLSKSPKYSQEFEVFWSRYPVGFGVKTKAFDAWKRLSADDRDLVLPALDRWKECERWQQGYVKAAEIWLRDRIWEQPPPPPKPKVVSINGRSHAAKPDFVEIARDLRAKEHKDPWD